MRDVRRDTPGSTRMGTNRPPSLMGSLGLSLRELMRMLGTKPQYRASGYQDTSVPHPRMAFQS